MEFAAGSVAGALLLTTLAGAATVLGAAAAFFTRRTNTRALSVALGLSGGVMVYISFVELLPEPTASCGRCSAGRPARLFRWGRFSAECCWRR